MNTSHTGLLKQLHTYVEEYVKHISSEASNPDFNANAQLRQIIAELEQVQTQADRPAKLAEVTHHISDQLEQLRLAHQHPHKHHLASAQKLTLGQALHASRAKCSRVSAECPVDLGGQEIA